MFIGAADAAPIFCGPAARPRPPGKRIVNACECYSLAMIREEWPMPADELSAPLGQDKRPRQRRKGLSFLQLVAAALGALAITIVGWAMLVEDPLGGEPMAIAPVDLAAAAKAKPEKADSAAGEERTGLSRDGGNGSCNEPPAAALPPSRTVTIIDGTSGQRREIVIPGPPNSGSDEQSVAARPARGALPKGAADGRPSARTISVR
jgi:hypothetical protein